MKISYYYRSTLATRKNFNELVIHVLFVGTD